MISKAIKREAMGSNIVQPVYLIMIVEMMTPTDPSVSYPSALLSIPRYAALPL
jgi:hypothetical protein